MLFSKRDLFRIIVPLMIEQALGVAIGIVDSMMVASAGEAAVSGVSLVDTLNLLLVFIFSAFATGGAVTVSQYIGSGDMEKSNNAAKQLLWVVLSIALTVAAVAVVFRNSVLSMMFGSVEAEIMKNARVYFLFTALSYPFLGLYNAGAANFRAMGNSRISMIASLIMNIINVIGNAVLIFGFGMGAAGAAISTLFSRIVGAVIMLVLLRDRRNIIYVDRFFSYKPDFSIIKQICSIGIPNGLENGMFQLGKVITQSLISTFATAQIAANAVCNSLSTLQYMPGGAIGLAAITVIGRCIGAGEKKQAKQYTVMLVKLAYMSMAALCVVVVAFAKPLIGLYGLSDEASSVAYTVIIMVSIGMSAVWPLAFTLPNAFRAASDVRYPMVISVVSMWVFRVGLSYVFGKYMGMGIVGVWLAMICDWIFRTIIYVTRFVRGSWLNKYVSQGGSDGL